MQIDIVTEISCPWCLIAQHRLDHVLAADFPDLDVDIVHHPLLLSGAMPEEGLDPREGLKTRYGIVDAEAAWAKPEAEARASGVALDLSKQPRLHRTEKAHILIAHARPKGTQHALAVAITDAFFLEHRDIHDPQVLADIASNHGFTTDEVAKLINDPAEIAAIHAKSDEMRRNGVSSVPLIRLPDGNALQTAPEEAYRAAIEAAMAL